MTLNVTAIDPSMTCTGMANLKVTSDLVHWGTALIKSKSAGTETHMQLKARFDGIIERVYDQIWRWDKPDLIVMEGPSLHSIGRQHTMAGLWWKIFDMIAEVNTPLLIVPPTSRITYATGKGNAGKDMVMLAASRRYSVAPITDNNDADAVVLAAMGARILGQPIDSTLPKTHVRAMAKLSIEAAVSLLV